VESKKDQGRVPKELSLLGRARITESEGAGRRTQRMDKEEIETESMKVFSLKGGGKSLRGRKIQRQVLYKTSREAG